MNNKNTIETKMIRRFLLTQLLFTIVLFAFFFGSWVVLSQFTWYGDEVFYGFLTMVAQQPAIFLGITWIVGIFIISLVFYLRSLRYIGMIARTSEAIAERNNEYIELPNDLKDIEIRLNKVRMDTIESDNIAKEAEKRKNDLVVYLAHDLKTPLTSVIGYLTLLEEEKEISEELKNKYMRIALDKSIHLEDLINEFFEITRFNLSTISLNYSSTNLSRMVEQIAYEFEPLLIEKNLKYNIKKEEDIIVVCDTDKMQRVFDNIIRNAINYSYEDSTINIDISKDEENAIIIFENSGKTLPTESLSRIFEQFYRLDSSRTTKTGGSGLGLAIAKEIIEAHNGTIVASSEDEKITFEIKLPLV